MAIYRVVKDKDNSYVMVNKFGIYDNRLSWKAKAILFYCLSRPDDWEFHESEIVKHAKDGIDGTRSGIRELIKFNYIKKVRGRDDKGKFNKCIYEVYEKPFDEIEEEAEENKELNEVHNESEKTEAENNHDGNSINHILPKDITSMEKPSMDKTDENISFKDNTTKDISNEENSMGSISTEENPIKDNHTILNNNKLNNDLTNKRLLLNNDYNNNSSGISDSESIEGKVIEACKYYERAGFSSINSIIMDKIGALVEIYTYEWTIEAINTAVLNNKRSLNYVEGILRKWRANGKENNYGDSRNYRENKGEYKHEAGADFQPEYEQSVQEYDDSELI